VNARVNAGAHPCRREPTIPCARRIGNPIPAGPPRVTAGGRGRGERRGDGAAGTVWLDIGPMLAMATTRAGAAGLENVRLERGDAQVHVLPSAGFDAVVSRFGVMFFDDPHAAFANFARSLRSGGRVVFACLRELLAK
jgi:SAM-dependent methyltransferase